MYDVKTRGVSIKIVHFEPTSNNLYSLNDLVNKNAPSLNDNYVKHLSLFR